MAFFRDMDNKMDDLGWKAKLKIPPKDKRIQTSVSNSCLLRFRDSVATNILANAR